MPGPPPNPLAVRRNHRAGLTRLPAGGYQGRIPRWPLPDNPKLLAAVTAEESVVEDLEAKQLDSTLTKVEAARLARAKLRLLVAREIFASTRKLEAELWRQAWRTPQAAAWAKMRYTREVATFIRCQVAAELGSLEHAREARVRADSLGLSPKGMKQLMWTIADDELAERRAGHAAGTVPPSRRRLAALDDIELRRRQIPAVDEEDDGDEP